MEEVARPSNVVWGRRWCCGEAVLEKRPTRFVVALYRTYNALQEVYEDSWCGDERDR